MDLNEACRHFAGYQGHTFSDDNLVRAGGKWLIKEMKAGTVSEL
jgi:hypothetical protein